MRYKQKLQTSLLTLPVILLLLSNTLRAETILISATDFPPYEFAQPKDGLRGFDVEVVEAAFDRVGIDTNFSFFPWKRAVAQAKLGLNTGLLSCSYLPERDEYFVFSDPISEASHAFFLRKNFEGFVPSRIEDAKDRKVATVLGWAQAKIMKSAGAELVTYRSEELVFRNLLKGVVDYAYLSLEASRYRAKQLGFSEKLRQVSTTKKTFHICFSKKWPNIEKIKNKFSKGLSSIKADGTYEQIHSKYK